MAFVNVFVAALFLSIYAQASPRFVLRHPSHSFPFHSRSEWGAQSPSLVKPLKLPVPYVVIHHTYIPSACYTVDDCSAKMRGMQNYHKSLNWGDIGYNFCVGTEGGAYEGRGWDTVGIHAGSANSHSIGICLIGDWRDELPPSETLETTKALIAEGVKLGKISPDYKLIGHNQAMQTECPGEALSREITTWEHFAPGKPDFSNFVVPTASPTVVQQ